jgi:hypothetical protein
MFTAPDISQSEIRPPKVRMETWHASNDHISHTTFMWISH